MVEEVIVTDCQAEVKQITPPFQPAEAVLMCAPAVIETVFEVPAPMQTTPPNKLVATELVIYVPTALKVKAPVPERKAMLPELPAVFEERVEVASNDTVLVVPVEYMKPPSVPALLPLMTELV